jgi:hypothetical protein
MAASQIKTKARVKEADEVFTAPREVNAMLDLVAGTVAEIGSRCLEPSCGTGNFLVEILERKLATVRGQYMLGMRWANEARTPHALSSMYGVDIAADNVAEAKARLLFILEAHDDGNADDCFWLSVEHILNTNIIVGGFLNGAGDIPLVEYTPDADGRHTTQRFYTMADRSTQTRPPFRTHFDGLHAVPPTGPARAVVPTQLGLPFV